METLNSQNKNNETTATDIQSGVSQSDNNNMEGIMPDTQETQEVKVNNEMIKEKASRKPYDGNTKLSRTKAESLETINSCNGQLDRVELRAKVLIKVRKDAKLNYENSSDLESKRNIVLKDEKTVEELNNLQSYKSELIGRKKELLELEAVKVEEYEFTDINWS